MADAIFEVRRLAEIYDPLDSDRSDLDVYESMVVDELSGSSVLDIGCGTGTFACRLAGRGLEVVAADPAAAPLAVARRKPYADRVRWITGDATALPHLQVDVATMTGNVAQVFLTDESWALTLSATRAALSPGGLLVFEVRDPRRETWRAWNREQTLRHRTIAGVGAVETWVDLVEVTPTLVSFRTTFVFGADGAVLTSDSTLRFRSEAEIRDSLQRLGYVVEEIRDAPDRPGRELVFMARRVDQ